MSSLSILHKLVLYVLFVTILTTAAWPQASNGTVSGTVRDQTGATIPGASVSLTNTGTNITSKTVTNENGFYRFPGINAGAYTLSAEYSGMQKFERALTVQSQESTE